MRCAGTVKGIVVVLQSWLKISWVVLFPKNLQKPARCNPDFKCFPRKVDPIDETFENLAFRRRRQVRPAGGKVRGSVDDLLPFVHIIKKRFESVEDFTLVLQESRKAALRPTARRHLPGPVEPSARTAGFP